MPRTPRQLEAASLGCTCPAIIRGIELDVYDCPIHGFHVQNSLPIEDRSWKGPYLEN